MSATDSDTNGGSKMVEVEIPDYVRITQDIFDGVEVTVEYNSHYNGRGETVTVSGEAELNEGKYVFDDKYLLVDDGDDQRRVQNNGAVFNPERRHLGTVVSVTATLPATDAVDLLTNEWSGCDVDFHDDEIVIQAWDRSIMQERGFMEGTAEFVLEKP